MTERNSLETNFAKDPSIFYQHYKDHKPIGKGGFGAVFEAAEKYSGRRVAIKRVRLRTGTEQAVLEELKILSKLEHNNILRYHNSWVEPIEYHKERDEILFDQSNITTSLRSITGETSSQMGKTCDDAFEIQRSSANDSDSFGIVFEASSSNNPSKKSMSESSIDQTDEKLQNRPKSYEYLFIATSLCKNESLEHRLLPEYRSQNKINRFDALYIFYQIVEGVRYLHDTMNMIHCDLKPANILFSLVEDTVKIADFGLALTQRALVLTDDDDLNLNENKQTAGTYFYMLIGQEPVSFKRDIYALGIILFELLYPVSSRAERAVVLDNLRKSNMEFPSDFEEHANPLLKSLILQLVSHFPNERPTISDLKLTIRRRLETDDSGTNNDTTVSKIEYLLNNPIIKNIPLATDDIQYGIYDTSDQHLLLSDDKKLKLYNINGELIDEYSGLHDSYHYVGYVHRIVWCESLRQFFILCRYFLYAFTPSNTAQLVNMQKVSRIDKYRENNDLRFITCTDKHIFINYAYHTIKQFDIPQWFLSREWSKKKLNYQDDDEIRRTTCSTTNDYIAFNVRLDKCEWVVDFRRIDNNLTLLKRVQVPDLTIKHKLQLSYHEWLVSNEKNDFCIVDMMEEETNLKIVQTNIKSESDIYPHVFGNYFIVPIVEKQHYNELNGDHSIQRQGILYFYQWK